MKYFIQEVEFEAGEVFSRTAWSKARTDVDTILRMMGMEPVRIITHEAERKKASIIGKIIWHERIRKTWKDQLKRLSSGDFLFIQVPVLDHSVLIHHEIKKIKKRGVSVVLIVHDLESIRSSIANENARLSNMRLRMEEIGLINDASKIVMHNRKMIEYARNIGIPKSKTIDLKIFDYLYQQEEIKKETITFDKTVVIAGNLSYWKAGYVYQLPEDVLFRLYGVNYADDKKNNIDYRGSFSPDELPAKMEGSFGLVWDGPSAETCEGTYGQYLKINNPHKTSLYLAAGLPVFIWKEAALGDFIIENKVGICIESIEEIHEILNNLTMDEYIELKQNVEVISHKIRNGNYMENAIKEACK